MPQFVGVGPAPIDPRVLDLLLMDFGGEHPMTDDRDADFETLGHIFLKNAGGVSDQIQLVEMLRGEDRREASERTIREKRRMQRLVDDLTAAQRGDEIPDL